jgi:dihydrodipicolinate synthase/N-acetylneuraminate lyase
VPWDEHEQFMEQMFRDEVRLVLAAGFKHVYIFGTGGEGYAVDTARFKQVTTVFYEATRGEGIQPMVGVIGLSTATIVERLRIAHAIGFRVFQISLPSWGMLNDVEVLRFFRDVCGEFLDSKFLHYNLPRSKRVLRGKDYRILLDAVPNLVATKTTGGGLEIGAELVREAGDLQHFLGEGNFPHGSMFGECSLLSSYGDLNAERTWRLFEAGRDRDVATLFELQHEFHAMETKLWAAVSSDIHMDGAYDKMLVKLGLLENFPLRLLSPYQGFGDRDYMACGRVLEKEFPGWCPSRDAKH